MGRFSHHDYCFTALTNTYMWNYSSLKFHVIYMFLIKVCNVVIHHRWLDWFMAFNFFYWGKKNTSRTKATEKVAIMFLSTVINFKLRLQWILHMVGHLCGVSNHVQCSRSVSSEARMLLCSWRQYAARQLLEESYCVLFHPSPSPQLVLWGTGLNYFPQ